jgi:hypothetical protein
VCANSEEKEEGSNACCVGLIDHHEDQIMLGKEGRRLQSSQKKKMLQHLG